MMVSGTQPVSEQFSVLPSSTARRVVFGCCKRAAVFGLASGVGLALVVAFIGTVWSYQNRTTAIRTRNSIQIPQKWREVKFDNASQTQLLQQSRSCPLVNEWTADFGGNGSRYRLEQHHCAAQQLSRSTLLSKGLYHEFNEDGRSGYDFFLVLKPRTDELMHGEFDDGTHSLQPVTLQGREYVVVNAQAWGTSGEHNWCLLAQDKTGEFSCWHEQKGKVESFIRKHLRPEETAKADWSLVPENGRLFMESDVQAEGDANCCPTRGLIRVELIPQNGVLYWAGVTRLARNDDNAAIAGTNLASEQQPGASTRETVENSPMPGGEIISVDARRLLAEYEADQQAAIARYKNKKLVVTGVLTGIFVPPVDVSLRMAGKGLTARAFVTMGGPHPNTPEDTLVLPGVEAYSEISSLFGQHDAEIVADKLVVGKTATFVCTGGEAFRVSQLGALRYGNVDYSIRLDDCTLSDNLSSPVVPPPSEPESKAAGYSGAAGNSASPIFRIGGSVSAPRAIFAPDPEYSKEASRAKASGTVVLSLIIGADGLPRDIRVTTKLGWGLDEKAVDTVKTWKFDPATKDGKPVACYATIEVAFHYDSH